MLVVAGLGEGSALADEDGLGELTVAVGVGPDPQATRSSIAARTGAGFIFVLSPSAERSG
jgi:hypothetical protein